MSTKQLRTIILLGLFAVPFIPLVVSKSMLFPFIVGKAFYFRIIVEIIFAAWLVLAIKEREYRPKFSWISGAIFLFLLAIGLADIFSENPSKSFWSNYERMEGFIALLHFVAFYFVASSVIKTRELWNKLFATSLFTSLIMAVYGFLQLAGKITINQGGVRVDGTFGNASYLGIYMVFHVFLATYLFINAKEKIHKCALAAVALLDLIILYFTATRGAILGLLGGVFITFLFLLIKSERGDKVRKIALISVLSIATFVGIFLISKNSSFIKSSPVLSRFASISISEIKNQGRYYVWPIAWQGFLERPILGWGQEGFNFVFNKNFNPSMYGQEAWFDRSHNIVLDWLIAGGLLGLLSYTSILLALLFCLFKRSSLSKEEKSIFLGLLVAYGFHNLFVFDQIGSYILFFTLLAFVHHSSQTNSQNDTPAWLKKISLNLSNFFSNPSVFPVTSSFVVISLVGGLYFGQIIPMRQNTGIMKVLISSNEGKVLPLESYKRPLLGYGLGFPEALEHVSRVGMQVAQNQSLEPKFREDLLNVINNGFKKQIAEVPTDARYRLFYGMFLGSVGDLKAAYVELNKARELSPKKQGILFEVGSNLLSQNKKAEALAVFKEAYEIEPSFQEAKFLYGLSALASGDTRLANEVLSTFDQDKLVFDDRYVSVLASLGRLDEVIIIVKKRIEKDPTNMQNRITLTAVYLEAGQRQMAIATLQEIIRLDPSFKEKGEYYINEIRAGRNP